MNTDVFNVGLLEAAQVVGQVLQLFILVIVIEWKYWDAVVDVEGKTEAAVVNYQDIFQVTILENA